MDKFNAVPQRRPAAHNPAWTKDSASSARRPNPKVLAANRARMAAYIERVRRGEIKPLYLPAGQPVNIPIDGDEERFAESVI